MSENLPKTSDVDPLRLNDDELFLGIHNDVLKGLIHLPERAREIAVNAKDTVTKLPLSEYAQDFRSAIDDVKNHWWPPRP
jgi:hypothetical protein